MKKSNDIKIEAPESLPFDLNEFFGQATIQKAAELYDKLEYPLIIGNTMGIPSRNLSHWVKVLNETTDLTQRKKYTFVNFVWIKIVEQLRSVHVGFELIKQFKQSFLEPITVKGLISKVEQAKNYIEDLKLPKEQKAELLKFVTAPDNKPKNEESNFTMLHMIIIDSIVNKLPISVAVFSDGSYMVLDKSKEHLYNEDEKNQLLYNTYITVSISEILKAFLRSELSGFVVPAIGLLSYAENKLFEVVHSGDYEKIIIHFKDKKIKSLELKKSEDIKERIIDILNKDQFGEIIVKKHKGVITKIENTIKVTL